MTKQTNQQEYSNDYNDFQKEFKNLKNDFGKLKDSVSSGVNNLTEEWDFDDLEEKAKEAGKTFKAYLQEKQEEAGKLSKKTKKLIEENPVKTALIALAAGALLTYIIKGISSKN